MPEFEGTLNTVDDPTADSSPVVDLSTSTPDDVGGTSPAAAQNTDKPTDQGKAGGEEGKSGSQPAVNLDELVKKYGGVEKLAEALAKGEEADARFDKNPRFKQLLAEVKTLKEQLATAKPAEAAKSARDFEGELKDLDEKLENGDLSLAEYQKQARQIAKEQSQAEWEARATEAKQQEHTQKLQAQFLADHPYVASIIQDKADEVAEIRTANPLHDDISAAMALHIKELETGRDAAIKEAVDKAVKDTEARVRKDIEAKRTAKSLGAGPATPPAPADELRDTSKTGGLKVALAQKLRTLREAS